MTKFKITDHIYSFEQLFIIGVVLIGVVAVALSIIFDLPYKK